MLFQKRAGGGSVDVQPPAAPAAPKQRQQQPAAPPTFMEEVVEVLNSFRYTPPSTSSTTTVAAPYQQDNIDENDALAAIPVPPEDSEPLTLTSAIALVAGTTVGAGILALPAFTMKAGFLPSSLSLTGAWLYMVTTGLLIAEVNLNLAGKSHRPDGGLVSMARRTIGSTGAGATGAAYLFLHYALLVAYIAQGGDILTGGLEGLLGAFGVGGGGGVTLPRQLAPILFTATLGGALAFGNKKWLDTANDALVGLVVMTFMGLVALAGPRANPAALLQADWSAMLSSIPVMFVALVRYVGGGGGHVGGVVLSLFLWAGVLLFWWWWWWVVWSLFLSLFFPCFWGLVLLSEAHLLHTLSFSPSLPSFRCFITSFPSSVTA